MVSDEVDLIVWSSGHLDDASMIPSTESPVGKGPQRSMCTFSQGLDIGRLVNCMGATLDLSDTDRQGMQFWIRFSMSLSILGHHTFPRIRDLVLTMPMWVS